MPDREHVVRPHAETEEDDRHGRGGDEGVAEDRLAREDRNHFGDHAEGRQDHDIDLGMAEEPEEVLPEHRAAARRWIEEVGAELTVEQQHHQRRGERRQGADDQDRLAKRHPDEQRQPS